MGIKESLSQLNESLKLELEGIKKLKGKRLKRFQEVFGTDDTDEIYYTEYNIILNDADTIEKLSHYFKKDTNVLKVEIPEHGIFLHAYDYTNDQLFENYLGSQSTL